MARKLSPDRWLFTVTVALVMFGVVMVNSASAVLTDNIGPFSYYFVRQFAYAVVGLALMWLVMRIDYRNYNRPLFVYGLLAACLVLLVSVLAINEPGGARRWLQLRWLSFQPSELAKLAMVLFLALYVSGPDHRASGSLIRLLPCFIVIGICAGLIAVEPDLGTAMLVALVSLMVLFVACIRLRYVVGFILAMLPMLVLLVLRHGYQRNRIIDFILPLRDPLGSGYQIRQSLIAVGSGGLTGLGLGEGKQKLFFLPQPHTDFIYAVIGEELGLLGAAAVLLAFVIFFWRGLRAAVHAADDFGFMLGIGLTLMISLQALINMSVVLRLMPTKGIPLPFISMGGSSLIISLIGVGMLLNISQHASD